MAKTLQKTIKLSRGMRPAQPRRCQGPQDLSRLELECMKAIWLHQATTVAAVQEHLLPFRPLAYTTVLTVLDRLAKKGAVSRIKQGKAHLYSPALSFETSRAEAIALLLDFYFDGAAEKLMNYLKSGDGEDVEARVQAARHVAGSPSEIQDCLL